MFFKKKDQGRLQKSESTRYSAINPLSKKDLKSRSFFVKFYGLVVLLLVSLALLGFTIWLHKRLPDGAKSDFKLPFTKRELEGAEPRLSNSPRDAVDTDDEAGLEIRPTATVHRYVNVYRRELQARTIDPSLNPWLETALTFPANSPLPSFNLAGIPLLTLTQPVVNPLALPLASPIVPLVTAAACPNPVCFPIGATFDPHLPIFTLFPGGSTEEDFDYGDANLPNTEPGPRRRNLQPRAGSACYCPTAAPDPVVTPTNPPILPPILPPAPLITQAAACPNPVCFPIGVTFDPHLPIFTLFPGGSTEDDIDFGDAHFPNTEPGPRRRNLQPRAGSACYCPTAAPDPVVTPTDPPVTPTNPPGPSGCSEGKTKSCNFLIDICYCVDIETGTPEPPTVTPEPPSVSPDPEVTPDPPTVSPDPEVTPEPPTVTPEPPSVSPDPEVTDVCPPGLTWSCDPDDDNFCLCVGTGTTTTDPPPSVTPDPEVCPSGMVYSCFDGLELCDCVYVGTGTTEPPTTGTPDPEITDVCPSGLTRWCDPEDDNFCLCVGTGTTTTDPPPSSTPDPDVTDICPSGLQWWCDPADDNFCLCVGTGTTTTDPPPSSTPDPDITDICPSGLQWWCDPEDDNFCLCVGTGTTTTDPPPTSTPDPDITDVCPSGLQRWCDPEDDNFCLCIGTGTTTTDPPPTVTPGPEICPSGMVYECDEEFDLCDCVATGTTGTTEPPTGGTTTPNPEPTDVCDAGMVWECDPQDDNFCDCVAIDGTTVTNPPTDITSSEPETSIDPVTTITDIITPTDTESPPDITTDSEIDTDTIGSQTESPPATETDPIETDPIETDPIETDPIETDPIETDPVVTDPTESDPVETDPVESEPVETDPVESEPVETNPIETDPAETDPVQTDPVETNPVETDPVESEPVATDPVESDPVETEAVVTDPAETEPAETDTGVTLLVQNPTNSEPATTPEATPSAPATEKQQTATDPATADSTQDTNSPTSAPTQATNSATTDATQTSAVTKEQQTTASGTASATATGGAGGGGGGGGSGSENGDDPEPIIVVSWPLKRSVLANHAPLIVARVFTSFLAGAFRDVTSFEPVRQLFSVDGASGATLAGTTFTLIPVIISGVVADIGSGFASEAVYLDTNYCDNPVLSNELNPCWPPRVSTNRWALSVMTGSLAVVVVSLIYVVALWLRTPQGVTAEAASSISAVASVMGHPEVERDFGSVPSELSNRGLVDVLKDKKYTLGDYAIENDASTRWGIMPLVLAAAQASKGPSFKERLQERWATLAGTGRADTHSKWMRRREYLDYGFGTVFLALLGLCIAATAYVDDPRRIFRYSTRGWTVGIRVVFALLAIAIAKYWATAYADVQNLAHFARLHKAPCAARETINKKGHSLPVLSILPLLRMGYFLPAAVAFTALISEFLVICLAGLPYRPGQLRAEYLVCGSIATVMLFIMLVMIVFLHRWRRTLPHIPRQPNSVAAVMTYVAETNMSRELMSLNERKRRERERAVEGLGRKYGYGIRTEEDGRKRWVVDEVAVDYEAERKRMVEETHYRREAGTI